MFANIYKRLKDSNNIILQKDNEGIITAHWTQYDAETSAEIGIQQMEINTLQIDLDIITHENTLANLKALKADINALEN